jgi:DNA polymerase-3 subunit epsilon
MWHQPLPNLDECSFVALDTETTHLRPEVGKLVEVAAVRFDAAGRVRAQFEALVNPGEPISAESQRVHGISDAMVAQAPRPEEVVPQLMAFLQEPGTVAVAHNAPFDLAFLAMVLARVGHAPPPVPVLDTRLVARAVLPPLPSYGLAEVARYLGLPVAQQHRALADADLVRAVFLALLAYLSPEEFPHLPQRLAVFTFADADIVPAQAPPGFETLAQALEEGRDVVIRYGGGSKRGQLRRLTPLALYRHGSRIYLTAFCHLDEQEKSFRLDRILELRLAEGS